MPTSGSELSTRWVEELHELGFEPPTGTAPPNMVRIGSIDRRAVVDEVLSRLGVRRSAWNPADVRGEVEQYVARTGLVTDAVIRRELTEHLTTLAVEACQPLLARDEVPEHIRSLTFAAVLAVERSVLRQSHGRGAERPGA